MGHASTRKMPHFAKKGLSMNIIKKYATLAFCIAMQAGNCNAMEKKVEIYSQFHNYMKELEQQGIISIICGTRAAPNNSIGFYQNPAPSFAVSTCYIVPKTNVVEALYNVRVIFNIMQDNYKNEILVDIEQKNSEESNILAKITRLETGHLPLPKITKNVLRFRN